MSEKVEKIITVLGEIDASNLKYCQCHEHLFIKRIREQTKNSNLWVTSKDLVEKELNIYKKNGGKSIVDAQPIGCGRMVKELAEVAESTNINIIAATGFHKLSFYPNGHWIFSINQESFYKILINEIQKGMYIDGDYTLPKQQIISRAGIIKTAYEIGSNEKIYKKLLIAAAKASLETGVTIMCHTERGQGAMEIIKILLDNKVNAKSIIISHMDRNINSFSLHRKVAKKGVFIDFDTIGRFKYHSDEEEVKLIYKMVKRGYMDNILLSLDLTKERMKVFGSNIGLDYILTKFYKSLNNYDINERCLEKFNVVNSREALKIKRKEKNNV